MSPVDIVSILQKNNRLAPHFIMQPFIDRLQSITDKERAELEYLEWLDDKVAQPLILPDKAWRRPHGYSRIEAGVLLRDGDLYANIRFRPLLHDLSDNQHFYRAENTLDLLSINLSTNTKSHQTTVHGFNLLHIRSAPIYDRFLRSSTYDAYIGYNHGEYKFSLGFGRSRFLSRKHGVSFELLLKNSLVHSDGFANFVGIEAQINKRTDGRFRYGARYDHAY